MQLPAQSEPDAGWHEIRAALRRSLGDAQYTLWIEPLRVLDWSGDELVLAAPPGTEAWLDRRFRGLIEAAARAVLGPRVHAAFRPADDGRRPAAKRPASRAGGRQAPADSPPVSRTLNPRYSFDQFVIGDCNRLAHGAALAVAELPGQAYNPLFLHAPPGLGKTHLLHAIGNYVEQFGAGSRVRYTTSEEFTNHFVASLHDHSIERFKRTYRDADVLLIDDVQFLARKTKTAEEFFHTFNVLHESGRQLVFTADRMPAELSDVPERLRERFEAGLVATVAPPDLATRIAILRKRALLDGVELDDRSVLELIARRITDNVRALEGALIRIVAHHSLTGLPLDARLATQVLDELHPAPTASGPSTAQRIIRAVCDLYEVDPDDLMSSSRAARVNRPRQVAIFLTRELTGVSLQDIGAVFGGRTHGTVVHACRRVADQTVLDGGLAAELTELRKRLGTPRPDRAS